MAARKSVASKLGSTKAVSSRRRPAKKKFTPQQLEQATPQPPVAALRLYQRVLDRYTSSVSRHLGRISKLVETSSLTEAPLLKMERELEYSIAQLRKNALAAGKRIGKHSRREAARVLGKKLQDVTTSADDHLPELFADHNINALRRILNSQITKTRTLISEGATPEKVRESVWVTRNRVILMSHDASYKLHGDIVQFWAEEFGGDRYVWRTRQDPRVRHGHQRLEGTVQSWDEPPFTGALEGNNHPGQAVRCRCVAIPLNSPLLYI